MVIFKNNHPKRSYLCKKLLVTTKGVTKTVNYFVMKVLAGNIFHSAW